MYGCVFHPFWVISFFFISCSSFFVRLYSRVDIASSSLSLGMRLVCVFVCVCVCKKIETLLQYHIHTHLTQCHLHIQDDFHRCVNSFDTQLTFTITESTPRVSFWNKDGTRKKSQYLCNYTICNGKFVPVKRRMSCTFRMI